MIASDTDSVTMDAEPAQRDALVALAEQHGGVHELRGTADVGKYVRRFDHRTNDALGVASCIYNRQSDGPMQRH